MYKEAQLKAVILAGGKGIERDYVSNFTEKGVA